MAQIQRRRFLTGTVALLASQLTRAQQPGRTYIVGALPGGSAESTRAYRSTLAARLASGPSSAIGMTKTLLNQELDADFAAAIEAEAQGQAICMQTPAFRQAYEAFKARR